MPSSVRTKSSALRVTTSSPDLSRTGAGTGPGGEGVVRVGMGEGAREGVVHGEDGRAGAAGEAEHGQDAGEPRESRRPRD